MSIAFNSRRSMISARRGMVGASNPLAAQAGLNILRQGGNAADAAVATSAMMNVTDPGSCGVGGDCFALYFDAKTKRISALNGSGRAPNALTLAATQALGWTSMNTRHPHAVTVPGAVRGWHDLLHRHGSMSLKDVLADAIHYASDGYPVAPVVGLRWQQSGAFLRSAANAEEYLPNGAPPKPGQVMRLPGLANTLRAIAEGGPDAFYTGPIAEAIVDSLAEHGGLMSLDDLKQHRSTWDEPIATDYRGIRVFECPPNGQGLTALLALNIAERFDLAALDRDSPERLHLMVESMRLAWADAHEYIADMRRADVPVDALLSKEYAARRASMIAPDRALDPPPTPGDLPGGSRHDLPQRGRRAGQRMLLHQEPVHGFRRRHRRQGHGRLAAESRRGVQPTARASQRAGARQATLSHHYSRHGVEGRRTVGELRRHGRVHAAAGALPGHQRHGRRRLERAGGAGSAALVHCGRRPWRRAAAGRRHGVPDDGGAGGTRASHRTPVAGLGRGIFGRGQVIRAVDGVLHGGSEPRADGQMAGY